MASSILAIGNPSYSLHSVFILVIILSKEEQVILWLL